MVGWLRRLCGGWVRNAGNKTQLRLAGAGALPELGNNNFCTVCSVTIPAFSVVSVGG